MPPAEKRKTTRRALRYPAMIERDDESALLKCELYDASQEGAHLHIDDPKAVPDEFTLLLGYDGSARRRCKVKWRTESEIGVEFKKMPQAAARPRTKTACPVGSTDTDNSFDIESLSSR
jgi:hypothetical protein